MKMWMLFPSESAGIMKTVTVRPVAQGPPRDNFVVHQRDLDAASCSPR
jgi:hypothetical protein